MEGACGAGFAARSGWLEALALTDFRPRLAILCARRGGRLAGAVPVAVSRRFGMSWARSLPFGTYGGPLTAADDPDPGAVRAALARAFDEWLERERIAGGEVVHAPLVAGAGSDPAWAALAGRVTAGAAHIVDLTAGREAVQAGLRGATRRGLRHAERAGVEFHERPEALAEVHALYLQQSREWGLARPYPLAFLRAVLAHPSAFARLFVVTCGGRLEAGMMALSGGGETFLWWSGAARASRRSLSYPYLIHGIIEHACAAGQRRANIGSSGGREALHYFKEGMGAVPLPIFTYHLRPRRADLRYRVYALVRAARRRT